MPIFVLDLTCLDGKQAKITMRKEVTTMIEPYEAYAGLRTKDGSLRATRPANGYLAYIWRQVRFHAGIDVQMPVTCFFWLQLQLDKDGTKANVTGIIDAEGRKILDALDAIVDEMIDAFQLSQFGALRIWKGLIC